MTAAAPGDTVLVRTGGYASFSVNGKGLVVTADAGAFVEVPRFFVRDVPFGQSVRVHGISTFSQNDGPGLSIEDCDGPVWIEDCDISGPLQAQTSAVQGVDVINAWAATFHRCSMSGSFALDLPGGSGLRSVNSVVAVFDSVVTGGQGGNTPGGATLPAGAGAEFTGGMLYAAGTSFTGGHGGSGSTPLGCVDAGDGAPGLMLDGGASAHVTDSPMVGGAGGTGLPSCADGAAGPGQLLVDGTMLEQAFPARVLQAVNPVRPGENLVIEMEGVTGDAVFLWISVIQSPTYFAPTNDALPILGGFFVPDLATSLILSAGTMTAGGLQLQFPAPNPSSAVVEVQVQALIVTGDSPTGLVVSSGQGITALGAGF